MFVIDGDPREVTRSILHAFSDSIRNGWIGRSYHRLLTDAGFVDVVVHPETVPIFAAMTHFVVVGRRRG